MKYNNEISPQERARHQFDGFLATQEIDVLPDIGRIHLAGNSLESFNSVPESEVLGVRAEDFLHHCLQESSRYRVIARNIQVIADGITLREIDFLLFDQIDGEHIHLELAFKYYCAKSVNGIQVLIGCKGSDNLDDKVGKLVSKQFPLAQTPEAEKILKPYQIQRLKSVLVFKAAVFIKAGSSADKYFEHCVAGQWMSTEDFMAYTHSSFKYFVPEKQDWPVHPKHCRNWLDSIPELPVNKPSMVWIKKNEGFEVLMVTDLV